MGFGHTYVKADAGAVLDALDRHLRSKGMTAAEMTAESHPRRMKLFHENHLRLFWISPQIQTWTGIFEFRYYNNEVRERWGYSDENLALAISKDLGAAVYRMEVVDTSGFWMYVRYEGGVEKEYRIYEDRPFDRPVDPSHPRYELNRLIEREGIKNAGLGYENIPGPQVAQVEGCAFWPPEKIEGYEGFVHRAYRKRDAT